MRLAEFFETIYVQRKLDLSLGAAEQYRIAIRLFDRWRGAPVELSELSEDVLTAFLREYKHTPRSARTVNGKRQALLTVWQFAADEGHCSEFPNRKRVPRSRESRRVPRAWTPAEVGAILRACRDTAPLDGWDWRFWESLVLTIYDSSERIGALLKTPLANVDFSRRLLTVDAEHRKGATDDRVCLLHQQTVEAIQRTLDVQRFVLFPWPLGKRQIWPRFRAIIRAAGLPNTRRDLFHKLRRTSYTRVWIAQGREAATQHAGHRSDLSRFYLDPTQLPQLGAADVIERPA